MNLYAWFACSHCCDREILIPKSKAKCSKLQHQNCPSANMGSTTAKIWWHKSCIAPIFQLNWPPDREDIPEPSHGFVVREKFHAVYEMKDVWSLLTDKLFKGEGNFWSTFSCAPNSNFDILWWWIIIIRTLFYSTIILILLSEGFVMLNSS